MATVGYWIAIIADANFGYAGKHDIGTVVEVQAGFQEFPPSCKEDELGTIKRYFVPGARPNITPHLHKLGLDHAPVLTKAGVEALLTETAKGKARIPSTEPI